VAHRDRIREQLGVRDETLILIVAHNFRLKGVPTLLRAASELNKAGQAIHVAVAGGKKAQGYASWAKRLGLGGRVTFLGAVNDVVPYYAAADIYAQPTYYDPCSLVVLEALASGLPVITTRWNGAGEIITPGREGEILESAEDAHALAFALGKLVGSERRRELMGEAARQLAMKHTLEHNCREIVAVYEEIVRSRKKYARAA
jgi:UDP-glucose:(heptosyl)LPS alpha-1,3-glucosyltransferase